MRDVLGWVADPDRAAREVPALLRRSGVAAFEQDAAQFVATNDRTRTSITSTIMPALGWLTHPAAAAAAARPDRGFDVARAARGRATVFLLGAEEAQAAPLVCALTGHIAREARRLAATQPGGPAGPAADAGAGRGRADLPGAAGVVDRGHGRARGDDHRRVPVPGAAAGPLGGAQHRDDPEQHRRGDGVRRHPRPRRPAVLVRPWPGSATNAITTTDLHGQVASRTVRRVPVLPPAQIANLPAGRVVLFRRGIAR